jgi:hypothetical protein
MDLNQLLYHHQVALIKAQTSVPANRFDLVGHYRSRIAKMRKSLDSPDVPLWVQAMLGGSSSCPPFGLLENADARFDRILPRTRGTMRR